MFKITYNVKPPWRGSDAAGNPINSAAANKLGAKMRLGSKDELIEALKAIDISALEGASKLTLRELDDEETSVGLEDHFLLTITIQQPRVEEEATVNGGSRLDPNLISDDEETSEED